MRFETFSDFRDFLEFETISSEETFFGGLRKSEKVSKGLERGTKKSLASLKVSKSLKGGKSVPSLLHVYNRDHHGWIPMGRTGARKATVRRLA